MRSRRHADEGAVDVRQVVERGARRADAGRCGIGWIDDAGNVDGTRGSKRPGMRGAHATGADERESERH